MKKYRFILFGNVKEFYAHRGDFINRFITSYPQYKKLKLSDLKNLTIVN